MTEIVEIIVLCASAITALLVITKFIGSIIKWTKKPDNLEFVFSDNGGLTIWLKPKGEEGDQVCIEVKNKEKERESNNNFQNYIDKTEENEKLNNEINNYINIINNKRLCIY